MFFEKIFCAAGLAMGATVSIGQAVGAGDKRRAAECVGNTVTLFMVLAAALTAVLLVSVRGIVAAVSTPEAAVEGTVKYLTVCFIGIPFITAYNIISSILRGLGYRRAEYRRGQAAARPRNAPLRRMHCRRLWHRRQCACAVYRGASCGAVHVGRGRDNSGRAVYARVYL